MAESKKWWVTLYGPYGSSFMPLSDVTREILEEMVVGIRDFKLELLTQTERNQRK